MKAEKSPAKKLMLDKKTIARLNNNQMMAINGGNQANGNTVNISEDLNDGGCTSLRPPTFIPSLTVITIL